MRRILSMLALGAVAMALSTAASAHGNVGFSVSIGVPAYVAPPPVYYAPPPVYYTPPPVYYAPPPRVYYAPPRVYYAPPVAYYGGRPHRHYRHW